jgi:hypothetical protein
MHRFVVPGVAKERAETAPSSYLHLMTNQATLEADWPQMIGHLLAVVLPRSDDILSSPAKLGSLLTICTKFAEIEPIVRERATTLALQKHDVPGWSLVRRDGNSYVEAHRVIELCLHCPVSNLPKLLTTLAMQAGHTSQRRYQELCESAGVAPEPDAIKQSSTTVFLRRIPN